MGQRVPPLNIDLNEALFQPNQHRPGSPFIPLRPQSSILAADPSVALPRRARASWDLGDENRKRSTRESSSGLRILGLFHFHETQFDFQHSMSRLISFSHLEQQPMQPAKKIAYPSHWIN